MIGLSINWRKYSLEIEKYIDKCNKFAVEFGEDENEFWNEVYSYGQEREQKAQKLSSIKKQMVEAEKKMEKLKEELLSLKKRK